MYTLYYAPGTASFAVHWMLIELGVPFELKLVDFAADEQKSPQFLTLNPDGKVPVMVVDGQPRTEAAALLMLLAERHPEADFAPVPGSSERGPYLELMSYLTYHLMPAFRAWFYPQDFGGPKDLDRVKENARTRIERVFDRLDARLADGRQFLLGSSITAPDFLATMLARWSRNMPKPASAWPNLDAYLQRMKRRESLREVHRSEGLTDWIDLAEAR